MRRVDFGAQRQGCGRSWQGMLGVWWVLLAMVGPTAVEADGPDVAWRPAAWDARPGEPLVAVAVSPHAGSAVASGGTVRWRRADAGGSLERAAMEDLRDLAFGPDDALWIGTATGLFRWEKGARPTRRGLRGDAGAADIRRVVASADGLLIATGAGAYWSNEGRIFQPLSSTRVDRAVEQAAFLRPRSASTTSDRRVLWLFGAAGFERIEGLVGDSGLRILRRDRLPLPRPRSDASPVDLAASPDAETIAVLYPDRLALAEADARVPVWRSSRPVLAPGAAAQRIGWTEERIHLATDRGLFRAADPTGRFERIGPEPGAQPCVDLDVSVRAALALVLCRSGVLVRDAARSRPVARAAPGPSGGSADAGPMIPPDPPVAALRRRALLQTGLEPERDRALRAGLARRGWWPELGLQLGADFDHDDRRFADQSFVSGDYRRLFDRTRDRGTYFEATIQLDWNLGDVAYPDDSVDLSRELRQVLALRDDVSDEIHQLYFERARIRERLAAGGPFEPGEPARLRLRAEELAAGLDAWTGGWLSEWQRAQPSAPPESSSPNDGPENRGLALE